jgi:phasin family protein
MATTSFPVFPWFGPANPFARSAQAQSVAFNELARIGADAMSQVVRQQQQTLLTVLARWQQAAGETSVTPAALLEIPLETARFGAELALRNAGELAEIARRAQADMLAVLTTRSEEVAADAAHAVETGAEDAGTLAKAAATQAAEAGQATLEDMALASRLVD